MELDNPSSESSEDKTAEHSGQTLVDSCTNKTTDDDKDTNTECTTEITTGPSEGHAHEDRREAGAADHEKTACHTETQVDVGIG
jgi:hypothetical protein